MTTIVLSSCSWLYLNGDSPSDKKKFASYSVSADQIPADVKPLHSTPQAQILLEEFRKPAFSAFVELPTSVQGLPSDSNAIVYDKALFTEDTTWRGTVIVRGFVVIAPQATLRIEAGTVVRFAGVGNDAARLIIQGRIQGVGTVERPIVLTSDRLKPAKGDWGGISLVSSEKRNILEHCRIEYAASGIEASFSTISLKAATIKRCNSGIMMRDSVVQFTGGSVTESEVGIEINDSESELRELSVASCKSGIIMNRSSVGISSLKIIDNDLYGIRSDDCRVKITSADISGNGAGVRLKGGEGQIVATRFSGNRETALHLSGSRIKLQRCQFIDNSQNALHLEDGRALVWGNSFNGNKGFNLYNNGREDVVALQNWWGSSDRSAIIQKIYDAVRDPRSGNVQLYPWLNEKPQQLQ